MPAIAGNPYEVQSSTLELDGNTYENAIRRAECVPSNSGATFDTIDGDSHPLKSKSVWTLELEFAQGFDSTSLTRYLFDNEGELVPFALTPDEDATQKLGGNVRIVASNVGGTAKSAATSTLSLKMKGTPAWAAVA